jgi:hypothetical protein
MLKERTENNVVRHLEEVQNFIQKNQCDVQYFKKHIAHIYGISHANGWEYTTYFLEKAIESLSTIDTRQKKSKL